VLTAWLGLISLPVLADQNATRARDEQENREKYARIRCVFTVRPHPLSAPYQRAMFAKYKTKIRQSMAPRTKMRSVDVFALVRVVGARQSFFNEAPNLAPTKVATDQAMPRTRSARSISGRGEIIVANANAAIAVMTE